MPKIARVYESQQKADDAANKLKQSGFSASSVIVLTPSDADTSGARGYSKYLSDGNCVVEVDPPFGKASAAKDVMQEFGPTNDNPTAPSRTRSAPARSTSSSSSNVTEVHADSDAAPLSRAFGWKLLRQNDPTPLSDKWGWNILKDGLTFGSSANVSTTNSYSTGMFGLLSNNPAPFSSAFGIPLKRGATDGSWTQSFGRDLLSRNNPTPLSDKFGWRTLSENQKGRANLM